MIGLPTLLGVFLPHEPLSHPSAPPLPPPFTRLRDRDIVLYRHKDLTKASTIVLQPHTSAFLKMSNHQAVMETELRHYSAITRGKLPRSLSLSLSLSLSRPPFLNIHASRRAAPHHLVGHARDCARSPVSILTLLPPRSPVVRRGACILL